MIKRIKGKIKKIVDSRFISLRENQKLLQQINFNYNQISKLFSEDTFIPFTAWAISPSTILHVLNDITVNKRKAVIEFGAGASTFYIAKLIKLLKLETVFYTVESDPHWAKELQRQINLLELEDFVRIIYAPVVGVDKALAYKEQKTWYDIEVLEKNIDPSLQFDLVLVDGPAGGGTPYARYSAIPFLKKKMAEEYIIFLDDANRPEEQEILSEWQKMTGFGVGYRERYAILTYHTNFEVTPFQLT